ncbi:MAG: extracellular solute-binding protein [Chloroflexi bacterium]|nr:extracellular solute-binding protein [Chloroflexota bacterium]
MLALLAVVMALVLAACGQEDPTATPVPTATPTSPPGAEEPVPTATPDAAAVFQAEWDELIKAAQEEGEVVLVLGGSAGRNFRPVAEFWQDKFGIEAIVSTGSGSEQANRILAERSTGIYLVDVLWVGGTSANTRMVPANALVPIADVFIHPEVTDLSLWYQGQHWYADEPQQFVFTFAADAAPQNMAMRYNTDLVTQEDLDGFNSVFDYLDPKWKGKIVSLSPLTGGAGGTYFEAYVHPDIGPSWIDGFFSPDLDVTFTEDFRFIVDGVGRGKFAMGVAIGSAGRDLDALRDAGGPVARLAKDFKEGGVVSGTGSSDNMMVPTNQPHPNATKLFVNWFLSQEGQTMMHTLSEQESDPTLRLDVTDWGTTRTIDRRIEGQDYFFFTADPVYVAQRIEALDYTKDVYNATH